MKTNRPTFLPYHLTIISALKKGGVGIDGMEALLNFAAVTNPHDNSEAIVKVAIAIAERYHDSNINAAVARVLVMHDGLGMLEERLQCRLRKLARADLAYIKESCQLPENLWD